MGRVAPKAGHALRRRHALNDVVRVAYVDEGDAAVAGAARDDVQVVQVPLNVDNRTFVSGEV